MRTFHEAVDKLNLRGYYICNQFEGFGGTPNRNEYEVYVGDKCMIDHLTEAQVIGLSEILEVEKS